MSGTETVKCEGLPAVLRLNAKLDRIVRRGAKLLDFPACKPPNQFVEGLEHLLALAIIQIFEGQEPSNVGALFMERPPMTLMEYSGGGVTLMQQALADARGKPFAEIMRDDVLRPIGMANSSYQQPISSEHDRNAARAHSGEGTSRGAKWHIYPEMAAAGLWTTPSDLARFALEAQLSAIDQSNRVLSRTMVQEMLSPVGVGNFAVGFTVG